MLRQIGKGTRKLKEEIVVGIGEEMNTRSESERRHSDPHLTNNYPTMKTRNEGVPFNAIITSDDYRMTLYMKYDVK